MFALTEKSLLKFSCALAIAAAAFPTAVQARYVYSGNRCDHSLQPYRGVGVCGNRVIPEGRNRAARSFALECASGKDPHIRAMVRMTPEAYAEWKDLEETSRQSTNKERFDALAKMHALRLNEPAPTWSGVMSYETIETWTWTSCEEHESAFHCGTHQDESTCTREVPNGTDKDGHTVYKTETYTCYVTHANSCHYDEDEHEAVSCSNEIMDYKLTYAKPGADWHPPRSEADLSAETKVPAHLRYNPIIPNKYELLPGELENVATISNASRSTVISPTVEIGDAWNKYSHSIQFKNGGSSAACVFGRRYSINVTINTIERDNTRTCPNAFRFPTDDQGKPKDPFLFMSAGDKNNKLVDVMPSHIRLVDSSNGTLEMMSKQMRANALALEEAKKNAGLGKTGSSNATDEQAKEMFKDTQLRIMLIEKNYTYGVDALGRDMQRTANLYGGGEKMLTLDGKFYNVPLAEAHSNLYVGSGPAGFKSLASKIPVQLVPNTEYLYMVSMYQQNIPFYAQKGQKNVKWREFFRGENSYYSKPLVIPFKTPKVEQRGFLNRLLDY